ncbi:MAG: ferritin-like domain-containing protein [Leifsonia sp.]
MFEKSFITDAINRSAENPVDRRRFLRAAGLTGVSVGAMTLLPQVAFAHDDPDIDPHPGQHGEGPSDAAILNFALNLEYLEAEFYLRAVTGMGLDDSLTGGKGKHGDVLGGKAVPFETDKLRKIAEEIAADEKAHVAFLRSALGRAAVARPQIDLRDSFTAAAVAAGLIKQGEMFDVFANETNFLLGAFIFEDVGVTAYKGAAPLIDSKVYLEAAAGILAVEAYHAATIRTTLYSLGLEAPTTNISDLRDSVDGPTDDDQGIVIDGKANIVPTDSNGIAYSRSAAQVLNIVYLTPEEVTSGGFFPAGVNGKIRTSGHQH